jgi:hypothetical protein
MQATRGRSTDSAQYVELQMALAHRRAARAYHRKLSDEHSQQYGDLASFVVEGLRADSLYADGYTLSNAMSLTRQRLHNFADSYAEVIEADIWVRECVARMTRR